MKKNSYSIIKHLDFLFLDLLCFELAFFLACQVRRRTFYTYLGRYVRMAAVIALVFFVVVLFWNMYSGILRRNSWSEVKNVVVLCSVSFAALTVYCFLSKNSADYSRAVLSVYFFISLALVLLERLIHKQIVRKKRGRRQVDSLLFIREEDLPSKIDRFTGEDRSGLIINGIITYEPCSREELYGIPVVGDRHTYQAYVRGHKVESVFVYLNGVDVTEYVEFLIHQGVVVYQALRNLDKSSFRYGIEDMNGYRALSIKEREISLGLVVMKRLWDIVFSAIALVLSLPLSIGAAIAIKIEDGGPVIYASKRMGQYGKEFNIYKFRSMKQNADKLEDILTPEELEQYHREFKLDHDPRVTRVGNFLRKTSIDEIPQFWNVIRGDMAIIGPRPILREELERYYPDQKDLLLSLKPGITGYWQAYGRSNVTYADHKRQDMELYYIEHFSGALDVRILFRTVKAVITRDGAQ